MHKMLALFLLFNGTVIAYGQTPQQRQDTEASPTAVARSYFEAMDQKDLSAAEALFAASSSIFETGGNEGNWAAYRDHHIGAELDAFARFEISLAEPETDSSADDSMAFVAWPIEYHIELKDGRKIDSRGTVTFVLVKEESRFRIRHLHWSSKRLQGGSR